MKPLFAKLIKLVILATFAAMVVTALFFWPTLQFAVAVASSDSRPALLRDADRGTPVPSFQERFSSGTSETELLTWLAENNFETNSTGNATLIIHALPCNETVEVSWTSVDKIIQQSSAVVRQDGCL